MRTRIAFTEDQFGQLAHSLDAEKETAAVVAATLVRDVRGDRPRDEPAASPTGGLAPGASSESGAPCATASSDTDDVSLLAREISWVPEDAYLQRTGVGLSIASTGWVPAFRSAVADALVPVFVHTHPGGDAEFSRWDDDVDAALAAAAGNFGARGYASIVIAGRSDAPTATARLCLFDPKGPEAEGDGSRNGATSRLRTVDAIRVAGSRMQLRLPPDEGHRHGDDAANAAGEAVVVPVETFDRQIRMLGSDGQHTLHAVRAAVIGAGGTGSAVAVQLARLGVGEITLVDDDVVTAPTATRGHGMRTADLGRPKVTTLGEHLRDIGLGTRVVEVNATLHQPRALRAIQHADVVFSCVDGHGARMILNRFAYAHLTPVIDLAVLVAVSGAGQPGRDRVEIDERVTWLGPGTACLLCRGRLDAALAYAENLDPETRQRLAGEGYVAAAETPQPAIVTLTTLVAALATTEFLLRLTSIGSPEATELLLRPHLGDLRRNRAPQRPGCFCGDTTYLARGRRGQYLDIMWAAPPFGDTA